MEYYYILDTVLSPSLILLETIISVLQMEKQSNSWKVTQKVIKPGLNPRWSDSRAHALITKLHIVFGKEKMSKTFSFALNRR